MFRPVLPCHSVEVREAACCVLFETRGRSSLGQAQGNMLFCLDSIKSLRLQGDCSAGGGACAIDVDACSREHGIEGGHAPSRRSKMRLNPSTSGGAAESTSSMYACNLPEGPSMCQRSLQTACGCVVLHIIYPLSVTSFMGRSASFMNRVTSFMRRLPIRGGYVFDVGTFASSGAFSCQPGSPSRSS